MNKEEPQLCQWCQKIRVENSTGGRQQEKREKLQYYKCCKGFGRCREVRNDRWNLLVLSICFKATESFNAALQKGRCGPELAIEISWCVKKAKFQKRGTIICNGHLHLNELNSHTEEMISL